MTAEEALTLTAEWRAQLPPEEPSGVLCDCGSGRDSVLCHGRRFVTADDLRELEALARARDAAVCEPSIRARGPALEAFAAGVGPTIDEDEGAPPAELVEEGLARIDEGERRRLVAAYEARRPAEWREICRHVADVALAERALAFGAVEATIIDERPRPRFLLEGLEDERVSDWPHHVVACALRPGSIWSIDDAEAAAEVARPLKLAPGDYQEAVCRFAAARVTVEHVARVRLLASRLERQLPLDGLPRASAFLARGCRRVADDEGTACDAAVGSLFAFVIHLEGVPGGFTPN